MEQIKHECGVALIRLLKPTEYYTEKYGTWKYGLNKLYLLMEKQHNRGQEGAGIGCISATAKPGEEYIYRERATGNGAIQEVFEKVHLASKDFINNSGNIPFCGEVYMGHLRYSTTGRSGLSYVHPFLRRSNWRSASLMLCGNFNLTNVDEIFETLVKQGQHPRLYSDTLMIMEMLGTNLDQNKNYNLTDIIHHSSQNWDGGYVICGITGNTDMFAFRDPNGIRTAFHYEDEEIIVVASERPVIQTVMNVSPDKVKELQPGQACIVNKAGKIELSQILEQRKITPCSFERIYFSRGSDKDIYLERKALGRFLVEPILNIIGNELENTVFSFIPNTAEVAYYGMMEGFDTYLRNMNLPFRARREKVAIKDIKLRTFISEDNNRDDLAAHVYDITYGSINPYTDNLVIIDDSIVRGTTLKQSIIKILDRLNPKRIIIVSSSPQIRYPDCYGIDMNRMEEFVAFRAAIALLKERGLIHIINNAYKKSKAQEGLPKEKIINYVKEIYQPFTAEEISCKIAELLTPEGTQAGVKIVFQSIEGLHKACPNHKGDWYFTGNYPTPGGNRVVNRAFINYIENNLASSHFIEN